MFPGTTDLPAYQRELKWGSQEHPIRCGAAGRAPVPQQQRSSLRACVRGLLLRPARLLPLPCRCCRAVLVFTDPADWYR